MLDNSIIYEKNITALREYHPELVLKTKSTLPGNANPINSRNSEVTADLSGILLHSRYNPVKEASTFVFASGIENGSNVICYGLGLGYHIEEIIRTIGAKGKCYLIELNRDIFNTALILRDLTELIKHKNLIFITGDDEKQLAEKFSALFAGAEEKDFRIVLHPPSFKLMPGGFDTIKNALEVIMMERSMPEVFKTTSLNNLVRNLDDILVSPGIDEVFPAFRGMPAFLVSAGPSLDEALPYLNDLQKRAWIFAVDTALSALIDASIIPDFVTTVDPQKESKNHFKDCGDKNIPLIFLPTASFEVIAGYAGPKIVAVQSGHSLVSRIEHLINEKGTISSGGSTACITLDIMVKYGMNPVFLAGQDCAFPDMKVYSSNVQWTRNMLTALGKFTTLEMKHRDVATSKKLVKVRDKYGQPVRTHQNLYSYLRELERVIAGKPEISFYNFFSKGASIDGVKDIFFIEETEVLLKKDIERKLDIKPGMIDKELKDKIISTLGI